MDIVVTVPKKMTASFVAEVDSGCYGIGMMYWALSKYPTKLEPQDSIYFVVDGKASYVATVKSWRRAKSDNKVLLTCLKPKRLAGDCAEISPFRGFRYIKPKPVSREKVSEDDLLPF